MARYRKYSDAVMELFGEKVYKLSLDGGMSCPNRDGKIGTRGCSFCLGGSGDFAECGGGEAQIDAAKARVAAKFKGLRYIAYFQSYTNTYAPLDYLKKLYDPIIVRDDIAGISIGTRPDCLEKEKLEYLSSLARQKPVWVELGLQTVHEKTAREIRRGYELEVFDDAVKRLNGAGIRVVVHIILGLPGESREMMLESVNYAAHCGAEGIKLQLLHVLDGTDMAQDWKNGLFRCMEMDEYIDLLEACIKRLPESMTVHRLTGDGAKKHLLAPLWSADKKTVLNAINRAFERDDVVQGSEYR